MNANDDDPDEAADPEPQLPDPPGPRKSMEIRAGDTNLPDPPPPMLAVEEAPDLDDA